MRATTFLLRREEPADEPFLRRLYASTRAVELGGLGWTQAQVDAFLEIQFKARSRQYAEQYPGGERLVLLLDDKPAGRLFLDRSEREIGIIDIALLPEHRGAGIGTRLIAGLQAEAAASGQSLVLSVDDANPAANLYERLGFRLTAGDGVYRAMTWSPDSAGVLAGR